MGYDLASAQLVGLDFDAFINKGGVLPDVILVRKSYEEKRRKKKAKVAVHLHPDEHCFLLRDRQFKLLEILNVLCSPSGGKHKALEAQAAQHGD